MTALTQSTFFLLSANSYDTNPDYRITMTITILNTLLAKFVNYCPVNVKKYIY